MEILLKFWPIAAALGWLLLIWIGAGFYVCRQYTGTWNGLRYIFDYKYWCYSILNHWYTLSKQKGQSVDDFIVDFTKHFLMPHQKGLFTRMREKQRRLLVGTLSQEEFFTANFGSKPYTSKRHNQVCKRWEEYSMRFSDDR